MASLIVVVLAWVAVIVLFVSAGISLDNWKDSDKMWQKVLPPVLFVLGAVAVVVAMVMSWNFYKSRWGSGYMSRSGMNDDEKMSRMIYDFMDEETTKRGASSEFNKLDPREVLGMRDSVNYSMGRMDMDGMEMAIKV